MQQGHKRHRMTGSSVEFLVRFSYRKDNCARQAYGVREFELPDGRTVVVPWWVRAHVVWWSVAWSAS